MSYSFLFFSFFLFLDDSTTFTSSMSSSRPDVDSMRPAKESKGGEVGDRRWRRIQWSGLTDGGFPNPSMRSYGKLRRRRSQLSAFCLLSNLTRQGGNKKKRKGANVWSGWDGMWGWGRDTDGVSRGHIFDFVLYFFIGYFVHAPSVLPLTPSLRMHNLLCADWHRQTHIQFIPTLWNPPQREGIRGVSPPNIPLPHLFCSAIMFCQSQQQNGRSRKKNGKKKGGKKTID